MITASALVAGTLPEGLDEVRHPERDILRRTQRLWYAGPGDALRQHMVTRLGARFREVGLSAEGLAGLTTQDLEAPHAAALIVNALVEPEALVLGVRRVKRTYPGLAVTVVADGTHHDAFRRAGADECVGPPADADTVLHAAGRAQATCRASLELDQIRGRETRLRALLEHLPEAVMLVSPEHAVLAVNLAALRLIGAQDARQVIGSPLTPWFGAADDEANSPVTLVDGVAQGSPRELFTQTRHLADPRRLQLRAVPFQRETGGPPAALIVLRELAEPMPAETTSATPIEDPSVVDDMRRVWDAERAAWEAERAAWQEERAALQAEREAWDAERGIWEAERVAWEADSTAWQAERTGLDADRATWEAERQAWEETRMELTGVISSLSTELAEARATEVALREALDTLPDSPEPDLEARALWDADRALLTGQIATLTAQVETLSGRLEEAKRLEDALMEARADLAVATSGAERVRALQARVDQVESLGIQFEDIPALLESTRRLALLDEAAHDAATLRDHAEADAAAAERDAALAVVAELRQRVQDLETTLAAAHADRVDIERDLRRVQAAATTAPQATVDVPPEQRWLLQEIAQVGFVRTTSDGRVLDANDHAAQLCGHRDAAALVEAGALPLPLTLLAGDDQASAARFEVCLQSGDHTPPRWIAGARLPQAEDAMDVTWLLADAAPRREDAAADAARPDTVNAVLEAVASECAAIVGEAPTVFRGPRPIEAADVSPVAAQALQRARVLLSQVSSLRRRREGPAALDELRSHMSAIEPVLRRLATDDVSWEMRLPDADIHVSATTADMERCVTGLVTSARDALPLGGHLALTIGAPAVDHAADLVRRPTAGCGDRPRCAGLWRGGPHASGDAARAGGQRGRHA